MAEMIDDIAHLSNEIGAHPAGTEEEQQAALYIAEELQNFAGFTTVIEDFQCTTNDQMPRLICYGVAFIAVVVALIVPVAAIPCFLLSLAAAVLYGLEIFGRPVLSRFFRSGASQNVVAKYQPSTPAGGVARRRKVILVAGYDTGKVLREEQPPIAGLLPILQKASAIALAVAAFFLFLRMTLLSGDTGAVGAVVSFLLVICAILFVLPLVRSVLHMTAPYSQSANNNASGVAVLLDVARTVGNGLVSSDELASRAAREGNTIHGEGAARAAGVVPGGASLEYDEDLGPEDSLAAAKAAIAALTGKPVADKVPVTDISSRLVKGGGLEPEDEAATSVRFEVGEPVRKPENPLLDRTMVSADEAEEPEVVSDEVVVAEQPAVEEAALEVVEEAPSFERQTPAALQGGAAASYSAPAADKTPAWARSAQAKARANKPEASQQSHVSRSRYADTVAAQLMETDAAAGAAAVASFGAGAAGAAVAATTAGAGAVAAAGEAVAAAPAEQSELAARLAALRSEIESAEAPHISDEAQAVLDNMETPAEPAVQQVAPARAQASAKVEPAAPVAQPAVAEGESGINLVHPTNAEDFVSPGDTAAMAAVGTAAEEARAVAQAAQQNPAPVPVEAPKVASTRLKTVSSAASVAEPAVEEVAPAAQEVDEVVEEAAEEAPASATTAMSPIDVSAFLDKEEAAEPEPAKKPSFRDRFRAVATGSSAAVEEELAEDVEDEAWEEDAEEASVAPSVALTNEVTQKVSSQEIQEAIQEAASLPVEVPPREYDETEELADEAPVASPIIGMEEMLPTVPTGTTGEFSAVDDEAPQQVIVLPDVVPTAASNEDLKQRAPMADASEDTKAGTKSLLSNMLPRIDDVDAAPADETADTFGLNLPALGNTDTSQQAVSVTGSFSTIGGTGSFVPVGDELVADIAPEDRYIDDADDSAYDEDYTTTGAFAGEGYVDMPKSRAGRLFGRFRKKNKRQQQDDMSVREWVGADENYDARSVGKARGDWSSFRQDDDAFDDASADANQGGFVDIDYTNTSFDNDRKWNGGAFSLSRLRRGKDEEPADEAYEEVEFADEVENPTGSMDAVAVDPAVRIDGDANTAEQINRELRKLQDFRHPDIDTEVWFVALGAEAYGHGGINAFLEEHASEMKGAIIINLEALGAGTLSCLEREGVFKAQAPSSRIKRVLRQAAERSGVSFRNDSLLSRETPASIAMAHGVQALTIAGMGEGNTTLYSADNDIVENIDPEALKDASNFVLNILKSM